MISEVRTDNVLMGVGMRVALQPHHIAHIRVGEGLSCDHILFE